MGQFISFIIANLILCFLGAVWFHEFWAEMTRKILGEGSAVSFFTQILCVTGMTLICVLLMKSFTNAWRELKKETTTIGKAGAVLVFFFPILAALFLLVGPLFEDGSIHGINWMYAGLFYGLSVLAMIFVVQDDIVPEKKRWAHARHWAWYNTVIIVYPFSVIGYFLSPAAALGLALFGAVMSYVATTIFVYFFKWAQGLKPIMPPVAAPVAAQTPGQGPGPVAGAAATSP